MSELFIAAAVLTMCLLAADSQKETDRENHKKNRRRTSSIASKKMLRTLAHLFFADLVIGVMTFQVDTNLLRF